MLSMYIDELPSYKIGYEKGTKAQFEKEKPKWKAEGKVEGKVEIVINMLSSFDDQKISLYSGLSIPEIQQIRKKHQSE